MIGGGDEAQIERIWTTPFAAPMAALQQENQRVFGGLLKALGVGLGIPAVLLLVAASLALENELGLEAATRWGRSPFLSRSRWWPATSASAAWRSRPTARDARSILRGQKFAAIRLSFVSPCLRGESLLRVSAPLWLSSRPGY
jgi:hypothetical protein